MASRAQIFLMTPSLPWASGTERAREKLPGLSVIQPDSPIPERATEYDIVIVDIEKKLPDLSLIEEALSAHRATGATITKPDTAWLPDYGFTIYAPGVAKPGLPLPELSHISSLRLHRFVPSWQTASELTTLDHIFRINKGIHISLSEKCTLGCRMCPFYGRDIPAEHKQYYSDYMQRRGEHAYITPKDFISFVDKLRSMQNVDSISLFGPGEPFLNPWIIDILQWCHKEGIWFNFTTNGNSIDERHLDILATTTVRNITLSVDAATAQTYHRIKPGASWKRLVQTAHDLYELQKKGAGFRLTASFIRQPLNQQEEDAFHSTWREVTNETVVTSRYHKGEPCYPPAWTPPHRLPCAALMNGIHLLTNGDCWVCSAGVPDEFMLGNIKTQDATYVWKQWRNHVQKYLSSGTSRDICHHCKWWRQTHHCEEYHYGKLARIIRPYSYKLLWDSGTAQ